MINVLNGLQMCFSKSKPDCERQYNDEDGSVQEEQVNTSVYIPESIHEHVDNVFLNFDVESEYGILAFIYEAGNEIFIVWTSNAAIKLCYEPFSPIADCPEFELL